MDVFSSRPSNKANIFLGLIECELNSLLGASHLVDYISVHIRFDLERYLLNRQLFLQYMNRCPSACVAKGISWHAFCQPSRNVFENKITYFQ